MKLKSHKLSEVRILIADTDSEMARVLGHALKKMGFTSLTYARDGESALRLFRERYFDVLITEWEMQPMSGIQLVRTLRQSDDSPCRSIPIIMLTARAEKKDVEDARDAGVTEFMVKPYTIRTLFMRIQELVDRPRGFMLTPSYIGPDRRRRANAEAGASENRRLAKPKIVNNTDMLQEQAVPRIVPPEYSLKKRIGIQEPIEHIITPHVLAEAQAAIDNLLEESNAWIKEDILATEALYDILLRKPFAWEKEQLQMRLLSVKGRAGTFGYLLASDVAQMLYRFLRGHYMLGNEQHHVVILKHIQALKVLFAHNMRGQEAEAGRQLIRELQHMTERLAK